MKNKLLWIVVNMCRLVVSATFVFSGLVKLIDPHGTEYKIQDYLVALNLENWVGSGLFPLVLSMLLGITEFCLGIYLLFSIRRRLTISLMLLLMLFYTPLTLWLALTNAVTDCGCFGDALHLTNWQTFGKNLVIFLMAALLWWKRRQLTRLISEPVQWLVSLFSIFYGLVLMAVCLYDEPVIDFRPFHIGQHIPSAMEWPDDPEQLPEILDFGIEPIPAVSSASVPSLDELLADTSYTFLLTAPRMETADDANMDRINDVYDYAKAYGYRFLCLTASSESAINRWRDLTGAEYDFAFTDELTLKTMARNNPALLLLCNGTIVGKWSHKTLPTSDELTAPLERLPLIRDQFEDHSFMFLFLLLWYIVPLALLTFVDRIVACFLWLRRWRQRRLVSKLFDNLKDQEKEAEE